MVFVVFLIIIAGITLVAWLQGFARRQREFRANGTGTDVDLTRVGNRGAKYGSNIQPDTTTRIQELLGTIEPREPELNLGEQYQGDIMTPFTCNHITILCSSIDTMREFYAKKLGMEVLEDARGVLALRAGSMRFSFFKSDEEDFAKESRVKVILRTEDIVSAKAELLAAGLELAQDIVTAPNFMQFLALEDPDGNAVFVAEYMVDPLVSPVTDDAVEE